VISAWFKNLKTEGEKKAFGQQLRNSVEVLERLQDLIKEDMKSWEITEYNYSNPSWAYQQAHINGQRSYASKLLKLLNLDQKETK